MKRPMIFTFIIILMLLSCGGIDIAPPTNLKPSDLKQTYIVYEYYADWCGSCKKLKPHLEKLEANYQGKIKVNSINIDHHQKLAQEKGVRAIPTLIISDGKHDIAKSLGYKSYNQLVGWIHKVDKVQ